MNRLEGILPYSQSTVYGNSSKAWENEFLADFRLVSSGDFYSDCGLVFAVGCLNVVEHEGMNLDGVDMTGKAVIKYVKNSCHRPLCPKCWSDWANRECDSAKRRLDSFILKKSNGKALKPIHVIVSVPRMDYDLSFPNMRKKAYRALKKTGLLGGMLIYHPKRQNDRGTWYYSPHFHVIGYGWIRDTHKNYLHSGYVVKNIGVRKSVRGTIYYQLSHAGVSEKFHTVTWFGLLAYNKLKVPKIVKDPQVCPLCGKRLRRLVWIGSDKDFIGSIHTDCESGFYFEDSLNYEYKPKPLGSCEPEGQEILYDSF